MSANRYPFLFATLGEAAQQLPEDIARALESTLAVTPAPPAASGLTLRGCLQSASARWTPPMASHGRAMVGPRRSAWRWHGSTVPLPG